MTTRIFIRKGEPTDAFEGLIYYRNGKPWGYAVYQTLEMIPHDDPEQTRWEWRDVPLVLEGE